MRKRIVLALVVLTSVILQGCGMKDLIIKKSGIEDREEYKTYQLYKAQGLIDENGYVIEEQDNVIPEESAHISVGNNNRLKIGYYTEEDCNEESKLLEQDFYLQEGEKLYAKVIEDNTVSSSYAFLGFNVYQYDEKNERLLIGTVSPREDKYVMGITEENIGREYSIEPYGEYQKTELHLNDYYVKDTGEKQELDSNWMINDTEINDSVTVISPIASHIISCEYDSSEFFFLSSEPECYYCNNEDGIVIFNQREATDNISDYSIELHKYLSVNLISNQDRKISIDGGDEFAVKKNSEYTLEHMKYGQTVKITTDVPWDELLSNSDIVFNNQIVINGEYVYTGFLPEPGAEFLFDPSEYQYEHGTIGFKCMGEEISSPITISQGRAITYYQKTAEEGYWLSDTQKQIIVTSDEDTKDLLENIHFTEKKQVTVGLPQPKAGGKIEYSISGTKINESSVKAYSGTLIKMNFISWPGWYVDEKAKNEYKVDSTTTQEIKAGTVDVKNIFTEDIDHMPKLTVVLDKSVTEKMRFEFTATGLATEKNKYESAWYRNDYTLINGEKIGTDQGINVTLSEKAIPAGKAVKIALSTTDSNGYKVSRSPIYIEQLPIHENLSIYESDIAKCETWYSNIDIRVSVVDIEHFDDKLLQMENAVVEVINNNTNVAMSKNETIEGSTKITYTICPKNGYYISGNGVHDGKLIATVSYKDFVKNIEDVKSKHIAKKIYSVTLSASDSYGKCSYVLDGKEVSGTINMREGQTLEIVYSISNEKYEIKNPDGVWPFIDKTKKTGKITFSKEMADKILNANDFGIEVGEVGK